jgi:hypothetical protein
VPRWQRLLRIEVISTASPSIREQSIKEGRGHALADKSRLNKAEAQRLRWQRPDYRGRIIAAQEALQQEPAHRAKMAAAGFRPVTPEDHREEKLRACGTPTKWSRLGIPAGMTRAEAEKAWAEAERQADAAIRGLESQGELEDTVIPESDEAPAKAAIHALAAIALGPMRPTRQG